MATRLHIEDDVYRILQEENTSTVFTRASIQSKINTEVGLVCRGHYKTKTGEILKSPLLPFLKETMTLAGDDVEVQMPTNFYSIYSVKDEDGCDTEIVEDERKTGYYVKYDGKKDLTITYQEKPTDMSADSSICTIPDPYAMAILPYLVAGNLLYDTEERSEGVDILNTAYQKMSDMYNNYAVPMTSRRRTVKIHSNFTI